MNPWAEPFEKFLSEYSEQAPIFIKNSFQTTALVWILSLGKKPIKDWEKPLCYGKPCGGRAAMASLHTEHADEGQQHCCCMDDCIFSMGIDGN